jgi:hypothetical protein
MNKRFNNSFFKKKYIYFLLIIITIILLIFFLNSIYVIEKYQENSYNNYHIISAKYNKNVNFLNEIAINKTVIQKNEVVPNKANEALSYLFYIINNYENLPENMIFIHDENESWHHTGKITEKIYEWIKEYENQGSTYYEFNNMEIAKDLDLYKNNSVFKNFWDTIMKDNIGDYETVQPEKGKCCAQFIVSKNNILLHSKNFYENYYNWLITNTNGEGNGDSNDLNSGHKTGRYAEYTWRYIFNSKF